RKLENAGFLVRQGPEREAPFEAQRSEWGEPADAEAPGGTQIRQAVEPVEARPDGVVSNRYAARAAVVVLEVPGVAGVEEDDPTHPHRLDQRHLELEVLEVHQVAADVGAVRDRRAVRIDALRQIDPWAERAVPEAADVEDTAQEEPSENRDPFG